MFFYFLIFFFVALQAILLEIKPLQKTERSFSSQWPVRWFFTFIFFTSIIGLRHEVGGDWLTYLVDLDQSYEMTLSDAIFDNQPLYSLVKIFSIQFNSIYVMNSILGICFTYGLFIFCRHQPRPWLALLISISYLIVVVSMGYSRQAASIGFFMIALTYLERGSKSLFLYWCFLAILMHNSAIIFAPMILFLNITRVSYLIGASILSLLGIYFIFSSDLIQDIMVGFIGAEYNSAGAGVRLAMNGVAAFLFLVFRNRFRLTEYQKKVWLWFSIYCFLLITLLFIIPSSTIIDRLGLFWIPLQIFVFSRLPDVLGSSATSKIFFVLSIIFFYFLILFVWLVYSDNSYAWMPYQFYPWSLITGK